MNRQEYQRHLQEIENINYDEEDDHIIEPTIEHLEHYHETELMKELDQELLEEDEYENPYLFSNNTPNYHVDMS